MEKETEKQRQVSAVITTYHRDWKCVHRAVESVLAQTRPVMELLLVDDNGLGSPWQQQIQKEAEKDVRIRYIPMEQNSGVSAARNYGAQAAKGDILGYLDDDDAWCADKLEKLVPLFEEDPEIALVFGTGWICENADGKDGKSENDSKESKGCRNSDDSRNSGSSSDSKDGGKYNWQWEVFKPSPDYADMLYTDYVGSASAPLLRLDVLKELGGFRVQPAAEDYELWIRIARSFKLRGIRDVVFYKHDEPGEHVSGSLRRVGYGFRSIYRLYREDYEKNPKAGRAMLWNICRTGVRGLDPTVLPYLFAWLLKGGLTDRK